MKLQDQFDFYVRNIENREYFSFVKLNHFFWQQGLTGSPIFKAWGVYDITLEIVEYLANWPRDGNLFLGIGFGGNDSDHVFREQIEIMKKVVPPYVEPHCALSFKRACINNKINRLYDCIRDRRVVVLGLKHLIAFGKAHSLEKFEHYHVELNYNREKILEDLLQSYQKDSIYLFQCGEVLSFWLIWKLRSFVQDSFFIDMGRALDFKLDVFLSEEDKVFARSKGFHPDFIMHRPWLDRMKWKTKIKLI